MPETLSAAQKVFGRDFFNAQIVTQALTPGFVSKPDELSEQEVEFDQARARGEFLIERVDKAPDGEPLTGFKIVQLLQSEFERRDQGKILFNSTWYQNEAFFMEETPRPGLALVSKEPIKGSTNRNYHQQTQSLADYLQKQVYKGKEVLLDYQKALQEWEKEKAHLEKLIRSDWKQAAEGLALLEINQTFREKWVEGLFDLVVPFMNSGERRLRNIYTWTNTVSSDGHLVHLGHFDPYGADVLRCHPGNAYSFIGVCFSRRVI